MWVGRGFHYNLGLTFRASHTGPSESTGPSCCTSPKGRVWLVLGPHIWVDTSPKRQEPEEKCSQVIWSLLYVPEITILDLTQGWHRPDNFTGLQTLKCEHTVMTLKTSTYFSDKEALRGCERNGKVVTVETSVPKFENRPVQEFTRICPRAVSHDCPPLFTPPMGHCPCSLHEAECQSVNLMPKAGRSRRAVVFSPG
ncbi:hypothetical protein STEG23_025657 [Scotinomys teguina]